MIINVYISFCLPTIVVLWNCIVGQNFNGPGHNLENLKISAIEKVFNFGQETILKRESMWINLFEAEHQGLNARK